MNENNYYTSQMVDSLQRHCTRLYKVPVMNLKLSIWRTFSSLGNSTILGAPAEFMNEHFLLLNELCGQNCFCEESREHRHFILSRDPVTPEKDRMPGRTAIKKTLVICEQKAPSNSSPQERKLVG